MDDSARIRSDEAEPMLLLTDYLVVGAGAMGMGFIDELIHSSTDTEAILLDTRAAPGGHWNDAYDFVRLHQPARTYGVNSRSLGSCDIMDLASKAEILEHYELALKDLVATGRVRWFPQCRYLGEGHFVSIMDPELRYEVRVQAKVVDATLTASSIPATTPPNYMVAGGVNHVSVNGLTGIDHSWERYMVIGAGKTGIDAVLYLLERGVDPAKICWVISNDCWFFSREAFVKDDGSWFMSQFNEGILEESVTNNEECLEELERRGVVMRLDGSVRPTRYRAATVTRAEVEQLNRVGTIRQGRISRIEVDRVLFHSGQEVPTSSHTLHVDCSAAGTTLPDPRKIFDGDTIFLNWILFPPPGFNVAVIAALELRHPEDEDKKNRICIPFKPPQMPEDFATGLLGHLSNSETIGAELGILWMVSRRTSLFYHMSWGNFLKTIWNVVKNGKKVEKKVRILCHQ
jgi:hypothetical protein